MILITDTVYSQQPQNSEHEYSWESIEGGVRITEYTGPGGDLVIPATLGGQPVLEIADGRGSPDGGVFRRKSITSVVLPSTLTYIGSDAFIWNDITSIDIPTSVTAIGSFAFYANEIKELDIPENIDIVSAAAFGYNQITSIDIPENIKEIRGIAFKGNNLTEITIPANVETLNYEAFADNNISKVVLETDDLSISIPYRRKGPLSGNPIGTIEYGPDVEAIPANFFRDTDLSQVTPETLIPETIQAIGSAAFRVCNLSELKLPDSLKTISARAFAFNELTEIVIPDSVKEIGYNAFIYNEIESAVIPGGVNIIGSNILTNNQENAASLTIYGELNSAAADYANSHGHTFKRIDDLVQYYSVYYRSIEHGRGSVPKDDNLYKSGAEVTVLDNSGNLIRYGYDFAGWNTKEDGTGTSYEPGDILIIGSENVILYAQWTEQSDPIDPDRELRAVINPKTLLAAIDLEFSFTADASSSKLEITSYSWNFGDGTTASGINPTHSYTTPGDYNVTLTIKDQTGNTDSVTSSITVIDTDEHPDLEVVSFNIVDASTVEPIGKAELKVEGEDYEALIYVDENGSHQMIMPAGSYQVSAVADGYMPRAPSIEVSEDNTDILVGLSRGKLVTGELTSREMTRREIEDAGIDPEDPDNQHVFSFKAEFEFIAGPKIYTMPIEFLKNNRGDIISDPLRFEFGRADDNGNGGGSILNEHIVVNVFPISERFFLVIYGEARWLKEMFNVELLVINQSAVDRIEDCTAELFLPEGLSLASMLSGEQTRKINIGSIMENSEKRTNWYVRGDEEGYYHLTAEVNGTFMPNPEPFTMLFETKEPLKVYAGSALKLTITAQSVAYRGERYHVLFELENVSDKPLYDISFGITGAEQFQIQQIAGAEIVTVWDEEDFGDSMTKSIESLYPGEKFVIDFSTTIWFLSILEFSSIDVAYYLTNVFLTALEGSTTEIPYKIVIEQTPHSSIINKLAKEVFKYGVKVASKGFIDIDGIEGAFQIYEYNKYGANSKATITVEQGTQLFGKNDNHGNKVIDVTTTSPNQIIEDNSIIINEDADIVVDFINPGEATLIIELDDDGDITTYEIPYVVEDVDLDLDFVKIPGATVLDNIVSSVIANSSVESTISHIKDKEKPVKEEYPSIYFNSNLILHTELTEQEKVDVNKIDLTIPGQLIKHLIDDTWSELKIENHIAGLTFDRKALDVINEASDQEDDSLIIETKLVDPINLSQAQQGIVNNRPVYGISAHHQGGPINNFGDGKIKVSIPYKLVPNENAENLYIYHLDGDDKTTLIESSYDSENQLVIFETSYFSYFVIGYGSYNEPDTESKRIALTANPEAGGEVLGAGIYQKNDEVTVTANPNSNYNFINWTERGIPVSSDRVYTFTAENHRNLVANFRGFGQEGPYHKIDYLVVEVGEDLVLVSLYDYCLVYKLAGNPLFDYLRDGKEYPSVYAIRSGDSYIELKEYAINYQGSVSEAIDISDAISLSPIGLPDLE